MNENSVEEYNEYGEIKQPQRRLAAYQEHRIHQTKDIFDGECSACQEDAKKYQEQIGWSLDDD